MPENGGFSEKRCSPRIPLRIPVSLTLPDQPIGISAYSHDISQEGLGLISDKEIPVGSNLEFRLIIPNEKEELVRRGTIVWASKDTVQNNYRFGVKINGAKLRTANLALRIILSQIHNKNYN